VLPLCFLQLASASAANAKPVIIATVKYVRLLVFMFVFSSVCVNV
jgi:hypothetical protein